jgi:hypothetical protein
MGGGRTPSEEGAPDLSIAGQRSISLRILCRGTRRTSLSTIARMFKRPPRTPSMASPARSGADSTESGDPQQPCKTSATEFFERSSLTRFSPARKCSTPLPRPSRKFNKPLPDGVCHRHQFLSGFFMETTCRTHARRLGRPGSDDRRRHAIPAMSFLIQARTRMGLVKTDPSAHACSVAEILGL